MNGQAQTNVTMHECYACATFTHVNECKQTTPYMLVLFAIKNEVSFVCHHDLAITSAIEVVVTEWKDDLMIQDKVEQVSQCLVEVAMFLTSVYYCNIYCILEGECLHTVILGK